MSIEVIILMIGGVSLCALACLAAEEIYEIHFKIKANENPLSKIVSGDHKKLDDRELWIKRYGDKVLLLIALVIIVPLINCFFFT